MVLSWQRQSLLQTPTSLLPPRFPSDTLDPPYQNNAEAGEHKRHSVIWAQHWVGNVWTAVESADIVLARTALIPVAANT